MGGGNGQKSKMARERNSEKNKGAKGSQLESNKKAMTIQCKSHENMPKMRKVESRQNMPKQFDILLQETGCGPATSKSWWTEPLTIRGPAKLAQRVCGTHEDQHQHSQG
ncbi:hypothetical protein OPV22_032953 [Ensete ventricosum]|uniref:Small EDRK-rich factor-like N-terminal domain-containing protein n=1 Tax=Ensete ventricosum TaxID=4639 RepID=A0AAV8PWU6_ENSVE|nr:hypothetical protein OPV22_032953 [Ensete ventricosum]